MSNKDIVSLNCDKNYNNIDKSKDNIFIFNLSLLKSKQILVSNFNNFNFDFSKKQSKLKYINNIGESSNINDNQLISEKKTNHINNCYLKAHDYDCKLPSSDKKWKKDLNMNEFERVMTGKGPVSL